MSQNPPPPVLGYASPLASAPATGRSWRAIPGIVLFLVLAISLFALMTKSTSAGGPVIPLSDFSTELQKGNVAAVTIGDDRLSGSLRTPVQMARGTAISAFQVHMGAGTAGNWAFVNWVLENRNGADVNIDSGQNLFLTIIVPLIPWLLIFGFVWFFVFRALRKQAGAQQRPIPVFLVEAPQPPRA